jgi:predicted dehydrogenase
MTSATLRVGVIGVGGAGRAHIRGFKALPDAEVVAIADTNPAVLATVGDEYAIADRYTDYIDLLDRNDIDAISTATPNFLHEPVVINALERGKHALTEKPLAHTLEAAERMVAAARQYGRVLHMVFNQRHYEDVATLKRFVDDGHVGQVYHAKAHWMRRQGIPGAGNWFSQQALSGGGPLIDLGVHVLDIALYLMGEPRALSVSAASYAEHGHRRQGFRQKPSPEAKHDVEDFLTAFIRLEGGATLTLDVSWTTFSSYGDDFGVALFGTDGGGEIDVRQYNRTDSLRMFNDVGGHPALIQPSLSGGEGHRGAARQFRDAIASGNWEAHTGEQALQRSRIVAACYRSAIEGREISLLNSAAQ